MSEKQPELLKIEDVSPHAAEVVKAGGTTFGQTFPTPPPKGYDMHGTLIDEKLAAQAAKERERILNNEPPVEEERVPMISEPETRRVEITKGDQEPNISHVVKATRKTVAEKPAIQADMSSNELGTVTPEPAKTTAETTKETSAPKK